MNAASDVLDPGDRDAMIRTVMAEAGTPDGWGAVANTIKNRLSTGKFGATPTEVVTAPKQFEVWSDGSAAKVDPKSDAYAAAGRVVDAVASGQAPDNTAGATHFYSPSGQAARAGDGRQQVPSWAKNQTASVAGNVFFAPNGPVRYSSQSAATTPTAKPASSPAAPVTFGGQQDAPDPGPASAQAVAKAAPAAGDDPFERMLGGGPAAAAPTGSATAPAQTGDDPFERMLGGPKTAQPAAAGTGAAAPPDAIATPGAPIDHGAATSAMAGFLNGVPIAGPTLLGGAQKAGAAIAALRDGKPYADELAKVQADTGATTGAHPWANTAGSVGGAVVGMAPAVAAAPEAFGVAGGNMLTRMGAGALSNAAIGGADATARGDNVLMGAGFGAAGGLLAPPVGKFIGNTVGATLGGGNSLLNAAMNKITTGSSTGIPGISKPAAEFALRGLNADGPQEAADALARLGPLATLGDTGPGMRGVMQAMTKPSSPEGSLVSKTLTDRANGAGDRIGAALDNNLGPYQDAQTATDALNSQRAALTHDYAQVHANAPPVDVSSVVQQIDSRLGTATGAQRKALQGIRNELVATPASVEPETGATTPETYVTSSRQLQNVRQDLDGVINYGTPGLGVEQGAVVRNQASLQDVRRSLDGALKSQVPGLTGLDGQSASLARQSEAIQGGAKVFGGAGPSPETLAAQRAGMSPEEQAAQNLGARASVDRMFGRGTQRSVVGLNKLIPEAAGDAGYNAQNIATMYGEPQANALSDVLSRERAFDATAADVIGKSNTNRLGAAGKLADDTQPGSLNLGNANPLGLVLQAGKSLVADPLMKIIMANPNASRNLEVARMMTAQGADAQTVLSQLTKLNGQMRGATGLGNALTGAVSGGIGYGAPAVADTTR